VKGAPPLGPQLDAQRAVSLVRDRAAEWGIDPVRIGIVGFSAGGHLSVATATNFEKRLYDAIDEVDKVSCRPDFAVACYSGYLAAGDGADIPDTIKIPAKTPPIMLVHSSDDKVSHPENSAAMYLALQKAGIPSELHIYGSGNHGFGVRDNERLPSSWPQLCIKWLKSNGLLKAAP
jgi:acetyl esterase/lipase